MVKERLVLSLSSETTGSSRSVFRNLLMKYNFQVFSSVEEQDIFNRIATALNFIGAYSYHDIPLFEKEVAIRQIREGQY